MSNADDFRPGREMLDAYLDGELAGEERARVAAALARHADLAAYVDRQEALRRQLGATFAPLMGEPIPQQLHQALYAAPLSRRARWAAWRERIADGLTWQVGIPAAACLVLGLVIGGVVERPARAPLVQTAPDGRVLARGALAQALDEQLASDDNSRRATQIGVSFRNRAGEDCRTFSFAGGANTTTGVACAAKGIWVVDALATAPRTPQTAYQMAGSEMPDTIRTTVTAMIAGEPFDAVAERAARDRHWSGAR